MPKKEIILAVTGSIAIYKACEIVRRLKEDKFNITVVMTKEAKEFITPLTFAHLSENRVYENMFDTKEPFDIEHISLAERADVILVAPATANTIAKIAAGICDDLLTCTVMAANVPVLIAPAMNENMYQNKITQGNINRLKSLGYKFIEPRKGRLVCGKVGWGCLAEVETIIKEVKNAITQ